MKEQKHYKLKLTNNINCLVNYLHKETYPRRVGPMAMEDFLRRYT